MNRRIVCIVLLAASLAGLLVIPVQAVMPAQQPTPQPIAAVFRSGWMTRRVVEVLAEVRLLPEPTKAPAAHAVPTLAPERWKEWPINPVVSARAKEIFKQGLQKGAIAQRFSKVGDCQVIRQYFLGIYDDPGTYYLGAKNENLIRTIDYFKDSWGRVSEAVRTGFNVASVLTPINANPKNCKTNETPLECEFRIWNPSIVLISMETWTKDRPTDAYIGYLRQIVQFAVDRGVLPIVATKADNLEGDHSINAAVARVAVEFDIPLWNFWRVANPLPNNGLETDRFHLTNAPNFFDRAENMERGWPNRNLTALQALDAVWKAIR